MGKINKSLLLMLLCLALLATMPVTAFGATAVLPNASFKPVQLEARLQKEMSYYSNYEFSALASNANITSGFIESKQLPDNKEILKMIGPDSITAFVEDGKTMWIGTKQGVVRINFTEADEKDYVQYLAGPRYIYNGDDEVLGLHSDGEQGVWIQNSKGVVHVAMRAKTLKEKSDYQDFIMDTVNNRRGMKPDQSFEIMNGEYVGKPKTNDNDGLWTAAYAIGQIFRYQTALRENNTEEIMAAKTLALEATKAVMLLTQLSGRGDGFPTRSYIVKGEEQRSGLWFEIMKSGATDGYALAVKSREAVGDKGEENFRITDETMVNEAKQQYFNQTGRNYDTDFGSKSGYGTDWIYPVVYDSTYSPRDVGYDQPGVVWRLKSEIKEEIDPLLAELYERDGIALEDIIYKADTSSDEVLAHFSLLYYATTYLFDDAVAEEAHLKELAIKFVDRMMTHILDNDFRIIDAHGNTTTWSKWYAEHFWEDEDLDPTNGIQFAYGYEDGPLNAIEIMSFLRISMDAVKDHPVYGGHYTLFEAAYDDLWNEAYDGTEDGKGYIHLARQYISRHLDIVPNEYMDRNGYKDKPERIKDIIDRGDYTLAINYSDEHLFTISFLPLIELELAADANSYRVQKLREVLDLWWDNMKREYNPLYTFMYQFSNQYKTDIDLQAATWMLYRMPQSRVEFPVINSNRKDLLVLDDFAARNKEHLLMNRILPPDEQMIYKYNKNPFVANENYQTLGTNELVYNNVNYLSGEMGNSTSFTLPYWMGRYYGMLIGE